MLLTDWEEFRLLLRSLGYVPSPEQEGVHRSLLGFTEGALGPVGKTVVVAGGEQAGKSVVIGYHMAAAAALAEPGRNIFWLLGKTYADVRREYDYALTGLLAAGLTSTGLYSMAKLGPWELWLHNGAVIKAVATADPTEIKGDSPDGIAMCEPGVQSYEAFEAAQRRTAHHQAWLLIAGTFEKDETAWFPDLWDMCRSDNAYYATSLSLPTYSNRSIYPLGPLDPAYLQAVEIIKQAHPTDYQEIINERWLGVRRSKQGLVFREFRTPSHVSALAEYEPEEPVYLAGDAGWEHPYALLFIQIIEEEIHIFDEIHVQYTRSAEVIRMVKAHPSFNNVRRVVLDNASKQHTNAQDSAYETWRAALAPYHIPVRSNYVKEEQGRIRVHDKLAVNPVTGRPYLLIHPRCAATIKEFARDYRLRPQGTGYSNEPVDLHNDAVKALTYFLWDQFGPVDRSAFPGLSHGSTTPPPRRVSDLDRAFGASGHRR